MFLNSKYSTCCSRSLEYSALPLDSHVLQIETRCGYYESDKLEESSVVFLPILSGLEKQI